ncbi:MAG: hypothetical protein ACD_81C00100G0012 [uncultured bacterium]|uniref:Uncharacterized protein n=1 Tax=Candidatus Wolfebacteria bacterium GW2011_GWE2_44_13 TaxID=1619017 RepID=A0A0G1H848_9BACT|nr:MAG: hypothetical protein ACD_81C00100G0012 [uncultured bacterium]KKT42990.1 MAG: hypothetical protein UW32_C0003G0093 [Candidatus Wolfebacteria bacterium GW2011_GWE2_44_13]
MKKEEKSKNKEFERGTVKSGKKYIPNGIGRGGFRPGSGRKSNQDKLERLEIKAIHDAHILEEVDVVEVDKATGGTRIVTKTRVQALLDVLYSEGHNRKNIAAIKEYFDRTQGKPLQGIQHGGEIKTEEQHLPTKAELAAAEAYERALDEEDEDE